MKKKVIAAGHICLDITPVFPEKTISAVTDILLPGKLIQWEMPEYIQGELWPIQAWP